MTEKERKKLNKMRQLLWLPLKSEEGEYLDFAGDGKWGVFGLATPERADEIRTHLRLNGATGSSIKKNAVLGRTYTVYFSWDFFKK